eukprot:TRINITY_DN31441_c0_g1_i1.p1 TRINITY_DN31441_c0_g1~~TRINITY_DN31441_c0_g1_i1.p1  ORF type:complete len:424 (-),score=76.31 TRINITY_DN31441_c0_g1_i1:30-1301(-)
MAYRSGVSQGIQLGHAFSRRTLAQASSQTTCLATAWHRHPKHRRLQERRHISNNRDHLPTDFFKMGETFLEATRLSVNDVLLNTVGLEIQKRHKEHPSSSSSSSAAPNGLNGHHGAKAPTDIQKAPSDSAFWHPEYNHQDRVEYLRQFEALMAKKRNPKQHDRSTEIVSEEDIDRYVDELLRDHNLRNMMNIAVPRSMYSCVVKVSLRVLQNAFDMINGQSLLGREIFFLKRKSKLSEWHVCKRNMVNEKVVQKLAKRLIYDFSLPNTGVSTAMREKLYESVIILIFRLVFDLAASLHCRVLGHTITLNIDMDEMIDQAPGWETPLNQGVFGSFDPEMKKAFVSDFVDDLLDDETVNLALVPDVLEKEIYTIILIVLFELLETACDHARLHLAGMSFRPATDFGMKQGRNALKAAQSARTGSY